MYIVALYIIYYNELMTRDKKSNYFRYIVISCTYPEACSITRDNHTDTHINLVHTCHNYRACSYIRYGKEISAQI